MLPLLPFAVGIIAGGLAVRFLRDENTRAGLHKAGDTLRSATQNSLTAIKTSTAAVRQRFAPTPAHETDMLDVPDVLDVPVAKPKAAPRKKKVPATTASTTAAAPEGKPAAPRKRAAKATVKPAEAQTKAQE